MNTGQPTDVNSRRAESLGLVALVVLALALRLIPIDHGMPRGYVPDGHMVRNALGMARDHDPVPPIGKYSTYPYFVPYLLLPVYAAEYALGRATGAWNGSGEFGNRAMERPGLVQLPARVLMAVFGALTCWAIFRAARAAGMRSGAWAAAWLAATCLLNLQFSTHERPWTALVFFGALSLWASIAYANSGRMRDLVLAALAAALSFASHQVGLAMLGIPACTLLFGSRDAGAARWKQRLARGLVCVAVFAAVALVAGYAYRVRHGATPTAAVIGGERAELAIGAQPINVGFSLASAARLSAKLTGYDPVLVVLGLAGLVLAFKKRELRGAMLLLAVFAGIVLTNPSDHVRYLLPACMLLTLPAGLVFERFGAKQPARSVLLALLAVPLVQALRFDLVLRREDTRSQAERALASLPIGATIAIDHYGPTPELSRAALERIRDVRGELRAREAHRMAYFDAGLEPPGGAGLDALGAEELFEVDPATLEYGVRAKLRERAATPRELLAALGVDYLVLAERRPGREQRPLASLVAGTQALTVIDPCGGQTACSEAFLPTEMDFALTALWRAARPGPRISIYRLAP